MKRKVLKLGKPIQDTFNYDAYILSILDGNSDNYLPWVFSNYILVMANGDASEKEDVFLRFADSESLKTELVRRQLLSWSALSQLNLDINEIVREFIDQEYYAYFQVDEYYIPETFCYQKEHFVHDIMIYGYDTEKQTFYVCGYNKEFLFSRRTCTFTQFKDALYANKFGEDKIWADRIRFYKYNPAIKYSLNTKLIRLYLEDYLNGESTFEAYDRYGNEGNNVVYGIRVYDSILDYISHIKESIVHNEGTRKLDYRIFRFLFQYKKLMLMRLEYISENNTDLGEIPEEYKEEYLCSKKIHGLALRFGVLNDTSILDKMSRYIIEMEKQDRIIFKKVIDKLL